MLEGAPAHSHALSRAPAAKRLDARLEGSGALPLRWHEFCWLSAPVGGGLRADRENTPNGALISASVHRRASAVQEAVQRDT